MENKKRELISIIIPFYNQDIYFDSCIDSALAQTYANTEIIIINDGSDKIFDDRLEKIQSKYPDKIKILKQENKGAGAARNLGIENSKGEYIAFLDSDDVWLPNKLEHQMTILKKNKIDFIHSSYLIVNDENRFIGKFISKNLNYKKLIKSCDIGLSTVLIKSDLIKKHLFATISTKEDYVCWLSVVKEINTLFGDQKEVMIYRDKKNSLSSGIKIKFINAFKVYYKYEKKSLIFSLFYTLLLSVNWVFKTYKIIYKNPEEVDFKYLSNIKNLRFNESFILSALNMASLSNINLFYLNSKKFIFWIDGYCAKFIVKVFNKVPGRKIIQDLTLTEDIKKIYLCGRKSEAQINYLKNKFNCEINFIYVPFFKNLAEINEFKVDIEDSSMIIINIATPKQEILALNILNHNEHKKLFLFCMGGGMSMVSGEEKIVPENIEKLNLEWLWRLRTNTWFRLKRLVTTGLSFVFKTIFKYFKKTTFKSID